MTKVIKHSPVFTQFTNLKAKHPDALLLFRMGDFYEAYNEDARACAEILGITLTTSRKYMDLTHMAGFPHHALDTYLPKLIRAGKRVAICDQHEPQKDNKLATRGIIEMNTPTNNIQEEEEMEKNKEQIEGIAIETLKALGGKLPTSLNKRFADALGTLPFISLKYTHNATIFQDEMNYLIKYAEIGLKTEKDGNKSA